MAMLEIFDIEILKNFFDVIYDSATIVEMKLDQEKLSIHLLNNGNIAFYNLEVSKDFFGDYTVDGVESLFIFVEDFYNILKSSKKGDTLFIESTEHNLVCRFESDNNRRVFELPLADESNQSPTPPSIDYNGSFTVLLTDLKQSVTDLDKIVKTNRFKIHTQENQLFVTAPSDAMTRYSQTINVDSDEICNVTIDLRYMQQILKLNKVNEVVTLDLGDGLPLSWNVSTPDELVKISGLIAPIIEEEG